VNSPDSPTVRSGFAESGRFLSGDVTAVENFLDQQELGPGNQRRRGFPLAVNDGLRGDSHELKLHGLVELENLDFSGPALTQHVTGLSVLLHCDGLSILHSWRLARFLLNCGG
jgi:hypothetical protein